MTRTLRVWQEVITTYAVQRGFTWRPEDIDTMLLRIASEVGEAAEATRDNNHQALAEELADIFIRLVNCSEVMGIDLEVEVERKYLKNMDRPYLHGRKRR